MNVATMKVKIELEFAPDGELPVMAVFGETRTQIGTVSVSAEYRESLQVAFDEARAASHE